MDPMTLAIGVCIGIFGGKGVKELLVKFVPATAPFFASFSIAQKQLISVVNRTDKFMHDNPDLKDWAEVQMKQAAAKLIK